MKDVFETNFSRNLSAVCVIAAPTLLFTSSLLGVLSPQTIFLRYILGKAGLGLFVFAIFALIQILRPQMEKFALIVGGMAIIGAINGATLYSFGYFGAEMKNAGFDATTLQTFQTFYKQIYITVVMIPLPGLFFPIGLLLLSVGSYLKKTVSRPAAIILVIAAITFPMGRIPGNRAIFVVTDFLFLVSMVIIGWQILSSSFAFSKEAKYAQI